MAFTYAAASDIASAALKFFVRGPTHKLSIQDRPLLAHLDAGKKTFPGGNHAIVEPVQWDFMDSVSGFFAGYTQNEALVFNMDSNIQQLEYTWYEVHAGLCITWTDLKVDGIHITGEGEKRSQSSRTELTRLSGILQNRLESFSEGYWREMNNMFWRDGTQDSEAVPGVQALFPDDNTGGSIGGKARTTYPFLRHRVDLGLVSSAANQTMTKKLRSEKRQLRRYGGKPSAALAGSVFLEKLEDEVHEKGIYTQTGFVNNGKNDIDMADIWMRGVGRFEYDPTMDDLGISDRCLIFDEKVGIRLRPMEQEENKVLDPSRPYDYAVFLRSMTWTGGLTSVHPNSVGLYKVS